MQKPLAGIKIIEIQGIGPAPFCGQFLVELGAQVTLIKRPEIKHSGNTTPPLLEDGKSVIVLDLKSASGRAAVMELVKTSDALIEGMRPGVMEKLGLGPDDVAAT